MTIPETDELLQVARRVMWSCTPTEALRQPYLFLAHVMTYGTVEDIKIVQNCLGQGAFCEGLAHAPPGIFDIRSWHYWHLMCDSPETPPLPQRVFPD